MHRLKVNLAATMVAIALTSGLAAAAYAADSSGAKSLGSFECVPLTTTDNFRADNQDIRIANLAINEQLGGDKQSAALSISYAVENRSSSMLLLNVDFLLVDASDRPLAAVTAGPPQMRVAAKRAEIGRDWTPVRPGTLAAASSICARIFYRPFEDGLKAP